MVLVFCAIYQAVLWRHVLIACRSAAVEWLDQEGMYAYCLVFSSGMCRWSPHNPHCCPLLKDSLVLIYMGLTTRNKLMVPS